MDNNQDKQSFFTNSTPLIVGSRATKIPRNKSSPNVAAETSMSIVKSKSSFAESIENLGRMKCMGSFTGLLEHKGPVDSNGLSKDELVSLRTGNIINKYILHDSYIIGT